MHQQPFGKSGGIVGKTSGYFKMYDGENICFIGRGTGAMRLPVITGAEQKKQKQPRKDHAH